jgi:hypothetical protein
MSTEFLPLSLRPDVPTITTDAGRRPVGIPDDEGYRAEIRMSPDGLLYVLQVPIDQSEYPIPLRDLTYTEGSPIQVIDEYTAAQLALARLLLSLRWSALDREALANVEGLKASERVYKLLAVAFDWPSWGTEAEGQARATITEGAPTVYETRGLGTEYDEGTLEVFVPDTVLRVYGTATCTLRVEIIFAHKDERAGFRGALVRALLGDPARDAGGRRVVVPEYFRAPVRLTLDTTGGVSYPDTPDTAGRGRWGIAVEVVAEVEVLGLVPAQVPMIPGSTATVG